MRLSILVVDDETDLLSEIARHLRRHGHHVAAADSFAGGQKIIDSATALDVLITDVRMPDGNGLDLARQARQRHRVCRIIVNTGHLDDDQIGAAEEAGANAVLFKPFTCRNLLTLVTANDTTPLAAPAGA